MSDGDNATPAVPLRRAQVVAAATINGLPDPHGRCQAPRRGNATEVPRLPMRPTAIGTTSRRPQHRCADGRRPHRQGLGSPAGRGADAPSRRARTRRCPRTRSRTLRPAGTTNPPPRSCRRSRCTTPKYRSLPTRDAPRGVPSTCRRAPSPRRVAAAAPRWSPGRGGSSPDRHMRAGDHWRCMAMAVGEEPEPEQGLRPRPQLTRHPRPQRAVR